jgi:branched-chain amino acid transport system substrate-binding protein
MSWLMLWTAGCGGSSTPAPIDVGHVATLSGPNKEAGQQAQRAINLAVQEQQKAAKENNKRPIRVRHANTKGNLDAFEAEAVRLVTVNHVKALLGGQSAAEVARLDKAQVPLVTPGVRTRGLSDLVFFTGLSPEFQGQVLARFAAENLHALKVFIFADERREESVALAEAFTRELGKTAKKDGTTAAQPLTLRYGNDPPVAAWAKRVAMEKPQAVLVAGTAPDFLKILPSLSFIGPILFGGDEGSGRLFLEAREADGVYLVTAFVRDLDVPRAKEFTARYREAYSEEPGVQAALAYDGARLLFEAIGQCQSLLTPEAIKKELVKLKDFPGLTGPLAFAEDRQLLRPAFVVQVEKNRLKTVKRLAPDG